MSSMDSPNRQRPLAGVDQAFGDGRARPPTELLDQLRERLSRLDPSHPSALPDHRPVGVEAEAASDDEPVAPTSASEEVSRPEPAGSQESRRGQPDPARESRRGSGEASGSPPDASPSGGDSTRPQADGATTDAADPGHSPFESGAGWARRAGAGDPYRPWFADGEPGTPWFAEQ